MHDHLDNLNLTDAYSASVFLYTIHMRHTNFDKALLFVKEKHEGQMRAGDVPTWHHLARVSHLLEILLNKNNEGSDDEKLVIPLAALGHDIIEDTDVTDAEVKEIFTERGFDLVFGMTNELGDDDVRPYVKKVIAAEEAVRLIKLSDLFDNITNVMYAFPLLGKEWTESFFMPVVTPMYTEIIKTKFETYTKTGAELISMVETVMSLLQEEIKRF